MPARQRDPEQPVDDAAPEGAVRDRDCIQIHDISKGRQCLDPDQFRKKDAEIFCDPGSACPVGKTDDDPVELSGHDGIEQGFRGDQYNACKIGLFPAGQCVQ